MKNSNDYSDPICTNNLIAGDNDDKAFYGDVKPTAKIILNQEEGDLNQGDTLKHQNSGHKKNVSWNFSIPTAKQIFDQHDQLINGNIDQGESNLYESNKPTYSPTTSFTLPISSEGHEDSSRNSLNQKMKVLGKDAIKSYTLGDVVETELSLNKKLKTLGEDDPRSNTLGDEAEAAIIKAFEKREYEMKKEAQKQSRRHQFIHKGIEQSSLRLIHLMQQNSHRSEITEDGNNARVDTSSSAKIEGKYIYLERLASANKLRNPSVPNGTHKETKNIPPLANVTIKEEESEDAVKSEKPLYTDRRAQFLKTTTTVYRFDQDPLSPLLTRQDHFVDMEAALQEQELFDNRVDRTSSTPPKKASQQAMRKTRVRRSLLYPIEKAKEVITSKIKFIRIYLSSLLLIIVPALTVACLLFYVFGNPIPFNSTGSYSWWIIFFLVRQPLTLTLSKTSEFIFIDFFSLRTRFCQTIFGPFITLIIASSRGWPYDLILWAVWDFALLYGNGPFPRHWLYYQKSLDVFNESNPSAHEFLHSGPYMKVLITAIVIGVATGLKRVVFGMYSGKRTYRNHGPELNKIITKISILTAVAHLGHEVNQFISTYGTAVNLSMMVRDASQHNSSALTSFSGVCDTSFCSDGDDDGDDGGEGNNKNSDARKNEKGGQPVVDLNSMIQKPNGGNDPKGTPLISRSSENMKLLATLGEWEEPVIHSGHNSEETSVRNVLDFFNVLSYMSHVYPFSFAFGKADTRDNCILSSEKLFINLTGLTVSPGTKVTHETELPFSTLCLVALDDKGQLDPAKVKNLRKLFRPNRRGNLSKFDFIKSCDYAYKKLKTFRAVVANASQIDHALEQLINVVFYFLLTMIILAINDINPIVILVSFSGIIASFAFMLGAAASKYFDGILFILLRRPFDVGDRISVSPVDKDSNPSGTPAWFVENVTLYATTVRYGTTNEVATYSNGSLANCRIINARRSPKAMQYTYMKFGIDVPYSKVKIFRAAVESFIKDRPREWLSMDGFRATRVEADLGFIEYVIVSTHFESWQNVGAILNSKSQLACYCLEVAKKMDMKYTAPPLPVNLGFAPDTTGNTSEATSFDTENGTKTITPKELLSNIALNDGSISQFATISEWFQNKDAVSKQKKTK